jgi:hypothetical protein
MQNNYEVTVRRWFVLFVIIRCCHNGESESMRWKLKKIVELMSCSFYFIQDMNPSTTYQQVKGFTITMITVVNFVL